MLPLHEDLLLLTMTDEEGDTVALPGEVMRTAFTGAALMELALQGRIHVEADRIAVLDGSPTGDGGLDGVLARCAAPGFDPSLAHVIDELTALGQQVHDVALGRLCDRGILARKEGRVMWILKTRRYPLIDGRETREVKFRLLDVLMEDAAPGPRDLCLLALVDVCDLLDQIVPPSEIHHARARLDALGKVDQLGQRVKAHIEAWERVAYTPPH